MAVSLKNRTFRRLTRIFLPDLAARLARLLWPVLLVLDDLALFLRNLAGVWKWRDWTPPGHLADTLQHDYETCTVPARAVRNGLALRLVAGILRRLRIVFVANVAAGMGHNTVEIDYYLRRRLAGELDPRARYVLLRRPSPIHDATVALYGRHFWKASRSSWAFNLLAPVIAACPELRLDCGLSRLKWHLRPDGSYVEPPAGQSFLFQIDKAENRETWRRYYRLRQATPHLHPLKDGLTASAPLVALFGCCTRRLALLHMKFHLANATARASEPGAYLPAIRWLQETGYTVVFTGREEMPAPLAELGVFNYAQSAIASYRHDLELMAVADLVITAGSGIALMPDCMGTPLVYLDSWHIGMPMASGRCVMVPALVSDRATGRTLSVREELDLYWSLEDKGDEIFPCDRYVARNASGDEVLEAAKEALVVSAEMPLTPLQERFRALVHEPSGYATAARVSEYFLSKHRQLLDLRVKV